MQNHINYSKLTNLMNVVRFEVPYYNNLFKERNTMNIDISYDVFNDLPFIDKEKIKTNYRLLLNENIPSEILDQIFHKQYNYKSTYELVAENSKYYLNFSSGTNGIPLMMIKSLDERIKIGTETWKLRRNIANLKDNNLFQMAHLPIAGSYPFPFKEEENNIYKIKKEIEYLNNNPQYYWWHIGKYHLEEYYNYMKNESFKFNKSGTLKYIESIGAYLSNNEKNVFEKIFNCYIIDHYGCNECWTITYSCKFGFHHINENSIFFELIDENEDIINDEYKIGQVVITALHLKTMPFIRYKLVDKAYYIPGKCNCGQSSKRICLVPGDDRIAGTKLNGKKQFEHIAYQINDKFFINNFKRLHVEQTKIKSFNVFVSEYTGDKKYFESSFLTIAQKEFEKNDFIYTFQYVNKIEKSDIFSVNIINGDNLQAEGKY